MTVTASEHALPPAAQRTAVCTLLRGDSGAALVRELARRGWNVGCIGMGEAPVDIAAAASEGGGRAHPVACEFDSAAAVEAAIDEVTGALGPMSLLIHGFPLFEPRAARPLSDIDEAGWTMFCESTMKGALFALQAVRSHFDASLGQQERAALTVALLLPSFARSGGPGHVPLATAAAGLQSLSRSAARQWGPDGISVHNASLDDTWLLGADALGARPRTYGTPSLPDSDIAAGLAGLLDWLAAPDARAMTGQTFVVDGGTWMGT